MKREVRCDPEILFIAINVFCREVLIPKGSLEADVRFSDEITEAQNKIAREVADRWKSSWHDDEM